jgi:hypothetical protein
MIAAPTERLAKKTRIRALFEKYGDITHIFGFPGLALKRQAAILEFRIKADGAYRLKKTISCRYTLR